jgi:septum site-determining protein MinC
MSGIRWHVSSLSYKQFGGFPFEKWPFRPASKGARKDLPTGIIASHLYPHQQSSHPMAKPSSGKSLEAKIATVVAVTLILHSADLEQIQQQLQSITAGQKDYFDHELAVVELNIDADSAASLDWQALLSLLRQWQLNPVAVRRAPAAMHAQLLSLGLSLDEVASRPQAAATAPEPVAEPVAPTPAVAPAPTREPSASANPCMIVDTPVRGGQRIYARGSDLVVTAIVNAGAELIADGSIHVYAPLRGRALAGAAGETSARIFALEMTPELISIAGIYRTFEEGPPAQLGKGPAEVRLAGDRLDLRSIGSRQSN